MESSNAPARPAVRSKVWIYYAVLAAAAVVSIPSIGWQAVLAATACGLYSAYLFRGGRFVIWFW